MKDESIDALSNPLQNFWLFFLIVLQRNAGLIFLTNKFDLQFSMRLIFENEPILICQLHLILPRCIRMFFIRLQQNQFKLVKEFLQRILKYIFIYWNFETIDCVNCIARTPDVHQMSHNSRYKNRQLNSNEMYNLVNFSIFWDKCNAKDGGGKTKPKPFV